MNVYNMKTIDLILSLIILSTISCHIVSYVDLNGIHHPGALDVNLKHKSFTFTDLQGNSFTIEKDQVLHFRPPGYDFRYITVTGKKIVFYGSDKAFKELDRLL